MKQTKRIKKQKKSCVKNDKKKILIDKSEKNMNLQQMVYTYNIYVYSTNYSRMGKESAELWIWKENGEDNTGNAYTFDDTELLDGSVWMKSRVSLNNADKIGIILKSFGGSSVWDWQTYNLYYENQTNVVETSLYIVDIAGTVSMYTSLEDVQKNSLLSIMEMVVSMDNRLTSLEHSYISFYQQSQRNYDVLLEKIDSMQKNLFSLLQDHDTSATNTMNTMNLIMQEMIQNMVTLDEGNRLILAKMLFKDMVE